MSKKRILQRGCETIGDPDLKRSGKHVRISDPEVVILVQELEGRSKHEAINSWYSSTDFEAVKDSIRTQCRKFRQARRFSDSLSQMYETACNLAEGGEREQPSQASFPTGNVDTSPALTSVSSEGSTLTLERDDADEAVAQWARQAPRGLEGLSSQLHAWRRVRHHNENKHAVFLEQARQSLLLCRDEERLAYQAARASSRARSFATLVGKADAWAVQHEQELVMDDPPTTEQANHGLVTAVQDGLARNGVPTKAAAGQDGEN
uniref:Uncharacterized protein n=1 Tax=Entomoneis paludosa TaxID=265537 RepID=A0A7S2V9U9_9STRA|mmetsp:Transcript_10043/g.20759  ORF Transcript_10043/g.20759 Transcript_10043/m.20759 type:complete len:263 (+) Transcript_10043:204-992(+)|eukprot:CAMPEP_0172462360 /NCGR_PEP_ID=MMETSP1065-20121228/43640_1 /TAXON_ID=265537 /ORGANISM="Amphiprora paludosa, Strain CCMP125" /LENGTH=262 /DNA_ID=CAMNT_0013217989 /DNA_START=158 /DNA_END=946 /DNA_ORIENTATION=-